MRNEMKWRCGPKRLRSPVPHIWLDASFSDTMEHCMSAALTFSTSSCRCRATLASASSMAANTYGIIHSPAIEVTLAKHSVQSLWDRRSISTCSQKTQYPKIKTSPGDGGLLHLLGNI